LGADFARVSSGDVLLERPLQSRLGRTGRRASGVAIDYEAVTATDLASTAPRLFVTAALWIMCLRVT
jgi:hypothetical protein